VPPEAIPGSLLDLVEFTLYSEHGSREIINDRNRTDVTADVDEAGQLVLRLDPADMAVIDEGRAYEYHRALIEWYWTPTDDPSPAVQQYGSSEVRLIVRNVNLVPDGSPVTP
jgi:hypothetical protein